MAAAELTAPGTVITAVHELLHLILRATPTLALLLYPRLQTRLGKVKFATTSQQIQGGVEAQTPGAFSLSSLSVDWLA